MHPRWRFTISVEAIQESHRRRICHDIHLLSLHVIALSCRRRTSSPNTAGAAPRRLLRRAPPASQQLLHVSRVVLKPYAPTINRLALRRNELSGQDDFMAAYATPDEGIGHDHIGAMRPALISASCRMRTASSHFIARVVLVNKRPCRHCPLEACVSIKPTIRDLRRPPCDGRHGAVINASCTAALCISAWQMSRNIADDGQWPIAVSLAGAIAAADANGVS